MYVVLPTSAWRFEVCNVDEKFKKLSNILLSNSVKKLVNLKGQIVILVQYVKKIF